MEKTFFTIFDRAINKRVFYIYFTAINTKIQGKFSDTYKCAKAIYNRIVVVLLKYLFIWKWHARMFTSLTSLSKYDRGKDLGALRK